MTTSEDSVYVNFDSAAAEAPKRRVLGLSVPHFALLCVGLCGAVTIGVVVGQTFTTTTTTTSSNSAKGDMPEREEVRLTIGSKEDYRNQTRKWVCGDCWCVPGEGERCPERPFEYTSYAMAQLNSQTLSNPMSLSCDPYKSDKCTTEPAQASLPDTAVCGLRYSSADCTSYSLESFATAADAAAAGFQVTHVGACGVCSSVQDLAVYMRHFDMTTLGKACAKRAMASTSWGESCYKEIGFTDDCSRIWTYNSQKTGRSCFLTCMWNLFADYNVPPTCEINNCLQCDEDKSGPLFKKFAGRTRRGSGLESAIQRPCDTVAHLTHHSCVAPKEQI